MICKCREREAGSRQDLLLARRPSLLGGTEGNLLMDAMKHEFVVGAAEGYNALAPVQVPRLLLQQVLHKLIEPAKVDAVSSSAVRHPARRKSACTPMRASNSTRRYAAGAWRGQCDSIMHGSSNMQHLLHYLVSSRGESISMPVDETPDKCADLFGCVLQSSEPLATVSHHTCTREHSRGRQVFEIAHALSGSSAGVYS